MNNSRRSFITRGIGACVGFLGLSKLTLGEEDTFDVSKYQMRSGTFARYSNFPGTGSLCVDDCAGEIRNCPDRIILSPEWRHFNKTDVRNNGFASFNTTRDIYLDGHKISDVYEYSIDGGWVHGREALTEMYRCTKGCSRRDLHYFRRMGKVEVYPKNHNA